MATFQGMTSCMPDDVTGTELYEKTRPSCGERGGTPRFPVPSSVIGNPKKQAAVTQVAARPPFEKDGRRTRVTWFSRARSCPTACLPLAGRKLETACVLHPLWLAVALSSTAFVPPKPSLPRSAPENQKLFSTTHTKRTFQIGTRPFQPLCKEVTERDHPACVDGLTLLVEARPHTHTRHTGGLFPFM